MSEHKPTLTLKFTCNISTELQSFSCESEQVTSRVKQRTANYMLITMGAHMTHFEGPIDENGQITVDHTFKPALDDIRYDNELDTGTDEYKDISEDLQREMKDCGISYKVPDDHKIKSHAVMWLYKRRYEDKAFPGRFVDRLLTDEDIVEDTSVVMRSYLIAATSINLEALMVALDEMSVSTNTENVMFYLRNNFSASYGVCTLVKPIDRNLSSSIPGKDGTSIEVSNETKELHDGLTEYDIAEKASVASASGPFDTSKLHYIRSYLQGISVVNNLVSTQQTVVKTLCTEELSRGELVFGDRLGASFLSGSTFLQLEGAAVCFTDMTDIVKNRVAEFPLHLLMVHAYTAFMLNSVDVKTFYKKRSIDHTSELVSVFKAILTAELIDPKQSEYYSDYNIYGIQEISEIEFRLATQPIAKYHNPELMGQTWFYEKYTTDSGSTYIYLRYILIQTEDQRQVCTADGLQSQMIGDDCETSAAFFLGIGKKWDRIHFDMKIRGIYKLIKTYRDAEASATSPGEFRESVPQNHADLMEYSNRTMTHDAFSGLDEIEKLNIFLSVANILEMIHRKVSLVVGSASAASSGGAKQMSGHCYAMLETRHRDSDVLSRHVIEGTSWVVQKERGEETSAPISKSEYASINVISNLLDIASKPYIKGGDGEHMHLSKDIGKCAMQTGRFDQNDFYLHVFMFGDSYVFQKTYDHKMTFGAEISTLVNNDQVKLISNCYKLLEEEIKRRGKNVKEGAIREAVRAIAADESVPAWPRTRWDMITNHFLKCKDLEVDISSDVPPSVQPDTILEPKELVSGKSPEKRHSFAFTHQYYKSMEETTVQAHTKALRALFAGSKSLQSTQLLLDMCTMKPIGMKKEYFQEHIEQSSFTPELTDHFLEGISDYLKHEKSFTSMSSYITICSVRPSDIEALRLKLDAWITPIVSAWNKRAAAIRIWQIEVLCGREELDDEKYPYD
jgi:hypothetical protein